jgi:hypothetical protein
MDPSFKVIKYEYLLAKEDELDRMLGPKDHYYPIQQGTYYYYTQKKVLAMGI